MAESTSKTPSPFDPEALLAAQRRNVEALTSAGKIVADGMRTYAERQVSLMQDGMRNAKRSRYARTGIGGAGGILQCVPFARENSGIEIIGNAGTWWNSASGIYERGSRPEVGSVLNFRATGRMVLGHVAVVSKVVDSRNIEIDQANWSGRGRISRNIDVVDVSPRNDWTAVRVAIGDTAVSHCLRMSISGWAMPLRSLSSCGWATK